MVYQSQKMRLECIRIVKKCRVNDIYICRDLNTPAHNLYTLLVIKEHQTVKMYLEVFEKADFSAQDSYIHSFSDAGVFCMVFEYKQERALTQFYAGASYSVAECENICKNLIMACITSNLPYPVLYQILVQGQLNLSVDHTVYLGYQIDLSELDAQKDEHSCVVECAWIIRKLLTSKKTQKAFSYRLLDKKIARRSYDSFTELYKDICIAATPKKEKGFRKQIQKWWNYRQNNIFYILLVVCIFLGVTALLSLLWQLIWGDIPWLRLFFNGFKMIGTETLIS